MTKRKDTFPFPSVHPETKKKKGNRLQDNGYNKGSKDISDGFVKSYITCATQGWVDSNFKFHWPSIA